MATTRIDFWTWICSMRYCGLEQELACRFQWYVKVCIFWKFVQYTIHWDKTQMLKQFPLDKINDTKNALFFLLWTSTYHSFTFNLLFLYELKHKFCLSKSVCRIFHFWFCFIFFKTLDFCSTKSVDSLTLHCHNSFQN